MDNNTPICYIFGYGSLMYPSGINGRGLAHEYIWDDLSMTVLFGYRRGMFACYNNLLYYGIMKSRGYAVNGVLVPIFSKADLEALLINEGAHDMYINTDAGKMYEVVDISTADIPTYTLVNRVDRSKQGQIAPWYVVRVWRGVSGSPWGKAFVTGLYRTELVKPSKWQMCTYPILHSFTK